MRKSSAFDFIWVLRVIFFMLVFFSVPGGWAATVSMAYPVATKAGAGSYPNIDVNFNDISDPIRPVAQYKIEWYPAGYPGWSITETAGKHYFNGSLVNYIGIQGYANVNVHYYAKIYAYDASHVEIGRTNLFTFVAYNNQTFVNSSTMTYQQAAPTMPTATMSYHDQTMQSCVPDGVATTCAIKMDVQHWDAANGAYLYKDEVSWSSLGVSSGTSPSQWTLDLTASAQGTRWSVRTTHQGSLIELASITLETQKNYLRAGSLACAILQGESTCEITMHFVLENEGPCIFEQGNTTPLYCPQAPNLSGAGSQFIALGETRYELRASNNAASELLDEISFVAIDAVVASSTPCLSWQAESQDDGYSIAIYKDGEVKPGEEVAVKNNIAASGQNLQLCLDKTWSANEASLIQALEVNQVYHWQLTRLKISGGESSEMQQALVVKPNIVMVYADDLGWNDVNTGLNNTTAEVNGKSNNIYELAKDGVSFSNAYANAANCSPSRASLMTGRYTPDHGVYTVSVADQYANIPQNLRHEALPAKLKSAGYETTLIGKWHLQQGFDVVENVADPSVVFDQDTTPRHSGFVYNIGGGAHGKPSSYASQSDATFVGAVAGANPTMKVAVCHETQNCDNQVAGLKSKHGGANEDLTETLSDYAVDYVLGNTLWPSVNGSAITRDKSKPFFLYFSHYAPHVEDNAKVSPECELNAALSDKILCMIESVDLSIQRVRQALANQGAGADANALDKTASTYIIFTSDNGMHEKWREVHEAQADANGISDLYDDGTLLKGTKSFLTEAGIREPLVIAGPSINGSGSQPLINDTPVIGSDLYATILGLAGVENTSSPTSVDIRGELGIAGVPPVSDRPLFWYTPVVHGGVNSRIKGAAMVVQKQVNGVRHKLINHFYPHINGDERVLSLELYDLNQDEQETCNLLDPDSYAIGACAEHANQNFVLADLLTPLANELCNFVAGSSNIELAPAISVPSGYQQLAYIDPANLPGVMVDYDNAGSWISSGTLNYCGL